MAKIHYGKILSGWIPFSLQNKNWDTTPDAKCSLVLPKSNPLNIQTNTKLL